MAAAGETVEMDKSEAIYSPINKEFNWRDGDDDHGGKIINCPC